MAKIGAYDIIQVAPASIPTDGPLDTRLLQVARALGINVKSILSIAEKLADVSNAVTDLSDEKDFIKKDLDKWKKLLSGNELTEGFVKKVGDQLSVTNANNITKLNQRLSTSDSVQFEAATLKSIISQPDNDSPAIKISGNSGANSTATVSSYTGGNTVQGHAQIEVNGTKRWVRYYDDPNS